MKRIVCACLILLSFSCGGPRRVLLQPTGTAATIQIAGEGSRRVELIAIGGDTLCFLGDGFHEVPVARINRLDLDIDRGLGWILPVIFTQALPTGLVASVMWVDDDRIGVVAVGAVVTGVTLYSLISTTPKAEYRWPFTTEDLEELRAYARYPFGLTEAQKEILRAQHAASTP